METRVYQTKEILDVMDEAIEKGAKSYLAVADYDKETLVAHCMTALERDADIFIYNNPNLEKAIRKLQSFLLSGKPEYAIDLMTILADGAVNMQEEILSKIFDERLNEYEAECKREAGFHSHTCPQTGETLWSR